MPEKETLFSSSNELQEHLLLINQKTRLFRDQDVNGLDFTADEDKLLCKIPGTGHFYPLRDCSKKSLFERLSISGESLSQIGKEELALILNICAASKEGKKAQICLVDDQIDAILSDNKTNNDYTSLPANELVFTVQEWLWTNFGPEIEFKGSWTHSYIFAKWILEDTFTVLGDTYNLAITVSTSDIGQGSIIMKASLAKGEREMPICDDVVINHRTASKPSDITEGLNMLLNATKGMVETLGRLESIAISYPDTTLKRVAKKIGLPKGTFYMSIKFPVTATNALECYLELTKLSEEYAHTQDSMKYQNTLNKNIWKAAGIDWAAYDLPGDFNW